MGYYYQIDYIDENKVAHYIRTFKSTQRRGAIKHVDTFNKMIAYTNPNVYFVLDKYFSCGDDDTSLIEENITNAESINMYLSRMYD